MSGTNSGSRDIVVFLIATSCLIGAAVGGLAWNAGRVRRQQTQSTRSRDVKDADIQSTGKIAIQLPGHSSQSIVTATMMPGESRMRWWWSAGSEFIYLLNLQGNDVVVDRVSVLTGKGTRVAEIEQRWYHDAFGTDDRIYLLRTDTRGRYQLIADIYSMSENRLVATQSLLDLPLPSRLVPSPKGIWIPDGSLVSMTVLQYGPNNESSTRTLVIDLQTGLPIETPESEPLLDNLKALAFSSDGSRLFLIHYHLAASSEAKHESPSLVVLDTQSGESQSIAIAGLPRMRPLAISDDAERMAFAFHSKVEIWNTLTGEKTASLPVRSDGRSPWEVVKVEFFAGGDFVAVADARTLSVYASDTGNRVSRFPDVPPNDQAPIMPIFLGRNRGELVVVGTTLAGDQSLSHYDLWMHRMTFDENGTSNQNSTSAGAQATNPVARGQAEWTSWMSSNDYESEFKKQVASGKYPLKVVGRNENGESQFRARFVDLPENLEFYARHDTTEASPRLPQFRNRRGQLRPSDNRIFGIQRHAYREIWRQWFVDQQGTTRYNIVWIKVADPE
ncbi:hypothetical protein [Stieleria mannarensis]|uniref:hypothetical protein n=1 Tax=Stieleria mannarensis TaxID=2755585 RepID=UPI002570B0BE|nr:hypothetical protein [Rhodopirellula sp. JC639]